MNVLCVERSDLFRRDSRAWCAEVEGFKTQKKGSRAYAWADETENPKKPRHVIVLHTGTVTSPLLAVRAAIIEELRNNAAKA